MHLILSSGTRIVTHSDANRIGGGQRWSEVNACRPRLHKEFDEALALTQLPERSDYAWVNAFLLKVRRQQLESTAQSTIES